MVLLRASDIECHHTREQACLDLLMTLNSRESHGAPMWGSSTHRQNRETVPLCDTSFTLAASAAFLQETELASDYC